MLEEVVKVIEIDKDDARFIWVETKRKSTCSSCGGKSACGTALLSKMLAKRSNRLKILNCCEAKAGDSVLIGIDEKNLLSGSFYLYLVPILAMISFSLVANLFSHHFNLSSQLIDLNSFLFATLGFISGFWLSKVKFKLNSFNYQQSKQVANEFVSQLTYHAKMIKIIDVTNMH